MELTFLVTYLGPGWGSIPSSVRSRTQVFSCSGQLKMESGGRSRVGWGLRFRLRGRSVAGGWCNGGDRGPCARWRGGAVVGGWLIGAAWAGGLSAMCVGFVWLGLVVIRRRHPLRRLAAACGAWRFLPPSCAGTCRACRLRSSCRRSRRRTTC